MSVPFSQILQEATTNPAHVTGYRSGTGKDWATRYLPITNTRLSVHTRDVLGADGTEATVAGWEAMVPRFSDDQLRSNTLVERPNRRPYRLDTESDMALWFHTEISNVVLAAWNDTPAVLQTSEAKAWTEQPGTEIVDVTYSLVGGDRPPLVIGEFKRNLVSHDQWQEGRNPSKPLSRELRGYAHKYKCPQVFCFDGETLLLLQFRADTPDHIQREDCRVDCWVIPRENAAGGCTLRQGLHNLLVQGFRRCQGYAAAPNLSVNRYTPQYREFFSGRPVFTHDNGTLSYEHPQNGHNDVFDREVDVNDGSVYWRRNGNYLVHDTGSIWG